MDKGQRIEAFTQLGVHLGKKNAHLDAVFLSAKGKNPWFTSESINKALEGILLFLRPEALQTWSANIPNHNLEPKQIGIVMAGNLPMVGFHDLLAVLITGNKAKIKLSSQDSVLLPFLINTLTSIQPAFETQVEIQEQLKDFDAVIATGSDNTARYFDHYFGKYPNIIRKNRTSVGVVTGSETKEELGAFGNDIYDYFGLGCRNISKIYFPKGYDIPSFIDQLAPFKDVIHHNKYCNNYEYQKSIYLVNKVSHLDNGFTLFKEETEHLVSPLSVLFYEFYSDIPTLQKTLAAHKEKIQCIACQTDLGSNAIAPGSTQCPSLDDYADNINTLEFLLNL